MAAPIGSSLNPFVQAMVMEYDRITKGLNPEELKQLKEMTEEVEKKEKHSKEAEERVIPQMLRCTLDYIPTMTEWMSTTRIIDRPRTREHIRAINGSAMERMREVNKVETEELIQKRGKVVRERLEKAQAERKKAADDLQQINHERVNGGDRVSLAERSQIEKAFEDAEKKLKDESDPLSAYDAYLTNRERLKTANLELDVITERLRKPAVTEGEQKVKEEDAKRREDLRQKADDLRAEIHRLSEEITSYQIQFQIKESDERTESSTARLMRHVYQTVMTSR